MSSIKFRRIVCLMLAMVCGLSVLFSGGIAYADGDTYSALRQVVRQGKYPDVDYINQQEILDKRTYKKSGGGTYTYMDVTGFTADAFDTADIIDSAKYAELTAGAKKKFLEDFISVAYAYEANDDRYDVPALGVGLKVTSETVNGLLEELQDVSGAGSQMLASILQDTKPDFASANRIYKPFSGVVSTVLGVICILIMSLLGVTMGLDIAYIVIPAFQLFLDGDSDSGSNGQGGAKGMAKIISQEAHNAVKSATDGGGNNGQTGSGNKLAISVYFKHRWKSLLVLGICLLYLVQGQIYAFVAWIIDLVSGFLGF